jgi:sedoheptulokinase
MDKKRCVLGLDFGTTKVACVLVDLEEGSLLDSASVDTDAYTRCKSPLYYEQDTDRVQGALTEAVSRCLKEFEGEISSIGITGQMHGVVGIDERGNPATNLVTWQDERGNEPGKNGRTLLEEMEDRGGERAIATGYGIVTLYDWIVRKRLPNISKVCTIPDYFGMRMTGRKQPVIDDTMADSTGAFDPWERAWDHGYISDLELDTGIFPDVVPPSTVLGQVRDEDILTLLNGSRPPVSVSIGDNQASYIGSVRDYSDTILVNIGTASQVSYLADGPPSIDSSPSIDGYDVVVRPFVEGKRLVSGNSLSGGCSYARLRGFFEETGRDLFGVTDFSGLWERMEALVSGQEDSCGLELNPLYWGKRSDPASRGFIQGLNDKNFTPSNLIYSTLEGVVNILIEMVDDRIIEKKKSLVGSGNALRKNEILRKVTERIFRKKLFVPLYEEEAAIGATINGAVACGLLKNFSDAGSIIRYI